MNPVAFTVRQIQRVDSRHKRHSRTGMAEQMAEAALRGATNTAVEMEAANDLVIEMQRARDVQAAWPMLNNDIKKHAAGEFVWLFKLIFWSWNMRSVYSAVGLQTAYYRIYTHKPSQSHFCHRPLASFLAK